jgi:hypothetical protein
VPLGEGPEATLRHPTTVLLLCAACALSACGGGSGGSGKALTRAELVAKVNAECQGLAQASTDLLNAQDPSAHGSRVRGYLMAAASQLRSRVDAIGNLVPPASIAGQVSRFVSLLHAYADELDAFAAQTHSSDTYGDLVSRSVSRVTALNRLADQANVIAARLGFTSCNA